MSAGHRHDGHPLSRKELEEVLADPAVIEELENDFTIDTDHDIPYLAGYSQDGLTRYVDRRLHAEDYPVGTIEIDDAMVDVLPFLVGDPEATDPIKRGGHEGIEKAAEKLRNKKFKSMPSYDFRHEVATGAERRAVIAAGHKWAAYTKALQPYIRTDETETLEDVPSDLDMTPYEQKPVDKGLVDRMREAMGEQEEKKSKSEVDYSTGTRQEHCGNCEHFEVDHKNGCEIVKGFIESEKWCKEWESEDTPKASPMETADEDDHEYRS